MTTMRLALAVLALWGLTATAAAADHAKGWCELRGKTPKSSVKRQRCGLYMSQEHVVIRLKNGMVFDNMADAADLKKGVVLIEDERSADDHDEYLTAKGRLYFRYE